MPRMGNVYNREYSNTLSTLSFLRGLALPDKGGAARPCRETKGSIMTRNIKAIGLALVAAFAMSSLMASAAQALEFHYSAEHTTLSGKSKGIGGQTFTAGGLFSPVTCEVAEFSGTATSKTATSLVLTPGYKNCKDAKGRTVHWHATGVYKYTLPKILTEESTDHFEGEFTLSITDDMGQEICHVVIKSQSTGRVIIHKTKQNSDLELTTLETKTIKSTTTGGVVNCGISDGEHTEGSISGELEVTGVDELGMPVELWVA